MSIERYNKTGLRDVYNVLKHLSKNDTIHSSTRKGGKACGNEIDFERLNQDKIQKGDTQNEN